VHDVSIDVPGGRVNVWYRPATGTAPTAVLIHGLSGNSRWWSRVLEHLPPEIGLVVPDVRGRAGSVGAPPPFDLATIADDIARALDQLRVAKAVVAGYSMGAWIAAMFARRHPAMLERLVLVDGGLPIPADPDTDADEAIEAVVGPSLARLDRTFADEQEFLDYWRAHPAFQNHWDDEMAPALTHELAESEDGLRVRANPEAIRVSARQITVDPETNAAAAGLGVRAHLIVAERGTADQPGGMIPIRLAEEAARADEGLTIEYLPAVNHYTLVLGPGAPMVAAAVAGR